MSGSETGVMASREPFNVGMPKSPTPTPSQPVLQNMRLAYTADGTAEYKHLAATSPSTYHSQTAVTGTIINGSDAGHGGEASGINVNMGSEPMKRKRGRPRKYGPDGSMALGSAPKPPKVAINQSSGGSASPTSLKKVRGRPPGSGKKQQLELLGSAGVGFTPHVITVKAGEDVSSKIMSFSQNGPRAVCILSANGAISNVTLRQAATSGGTVTYEGRFEILSLSGSFLLSENSNQRSRTGGLSVSLSGPDGRVLGGGVAGLLTAASPVQVVVGSFMADGGKGMKSATQMETLYAPPNSAPVSGPVGVGQSSSPSRVTQSESSGGPGSPFNQSAGACNNSNLQGISCMPWK